MSDEDRRVAELAIQAAGPVGSDERGWQLRVAQLSMQIGSMLRPPSPGYEDLATSPVVVARKVLNADVYRAEFVSFSEEEMERNHRLLVRVKPEFGKPKYLDADGCEWIRTEPRWTPAGFVMQKLVKSLAPTTPILVFKYVDSFTGKDHDTGDEEDKKGRVLAHLEVTGRPRTSSPPDARPAPTAERSQSGGGGTGGARQPTPTGAAPPPSPIDERLKALVPRQLIALKNYCVAQGWLDWQDPGADTIDGVLLALGKIEQGEVLA